MKKQPQQKTRPPTEAEMLSEFRDGYSIPPLLLRLKKVLAPASAADAILEATWDSQKFEFIAEFKSRSRPLVFEEAVRQAEAAAAETSSYPMVVLPFISSNQLDQLVERNVSGLDLSGNGVITIPNRMLVYRSGMKNQYPESAPTKYAYRGATSLVARVFLCRSTYNSLAEIDDEIRRRGGTVATSTISKALKRMEEDLIVERSGGVLRLLQADKLLENLAASYRPPNVRRQMAIQCNRSIEVLAQISPPNLKLVWSGRSSLDAYAVMGRDDVPIIYTDNITRLLDAWGDGAKETTRFADFELAETDDATVFFDARPVNGLPYASPIQAYVECKTGDKREKETADQVARVILDGLSIKGL